MTKLFYFMSSFAILIDKKEMRQQINGHKYKAMEQQITSTPQNIVQK